MGLVGLAKTLHLEGARHDIRVNAIAPTAGTRMTEDIFPDDAFNAFTPEDVVPAALFLVSDEAPTNAIVGAGGGVFQAAWLTMNQGILLPKQQRSLEHFANAWLRIHDPTNATPLNNGMEQSAQALALLKEHAQTGALDPNAV